MGENRPASGSQAWPEVMLRKQPLPAIILGLVDMGSGVNGMNSLLQTGSSGGICASPSLPGSRSGSVAMAGPEMVCGSGRLSMVASSCERALGAGIASLEQPRASP